MRIKWSKVRKNPPKKNSINGEKRFLSGLQHQNVEMLKKSFTVSCRDQQEALNKEDIFETGIRRKRIGPSFSLLIFLQLDHCQNQKQTSARMNFCDHPCDVIFLLFSEESQVKKKSIKNILFESVLSAVCTFFVKSKCSSVYSIMY